MAELELENKARVGQTSGTPRTAVVLAAGSNALGAVRSLQLVAVPTIAVATNRDEPVLLSRFPKQKLVEHTTRPEDREPVLLRLLGTIKEERPVLIPTSDFLVDFMVKNRTQIAERFDFCLPDDELVGLLIDKARETKLIASLGIPLPKTIQDFPSQPQELAESLRLPIIVKPRSFAHSKFLGKKNVILRTRQDLDSFYQKYSKTAWAMLAQEVIPGADDTIWVCQCSFSLSHELLDAFTFKRLRLSPPHYGVTSYAISQRNEEIYAMVKRLGKALRYTGPAMVEFKYDVRDGVYKYIELNPRIGLCNFLDTTCGVNNVYYTYQLAMGINPPPGKFAQRDGVMYLCLFDDLYSRLEDGESIFSALRHYASNIMRPHVGAHFAWDDLRPALVVGARDAARVGRSLLRKARRKLFGLA